MNCEACGHEMLVVKLGAFYTHYICPVCGHEIYYCPLPPDEVRDGINMAVKDYVGQLLTGEG